MEDINKLRSVIQDHFKKVKMLHLATAQDGKPWSSNVWFASDDDMNIYWISDASKRHSQEVVKNPNVSASVWLPSEPFDSSHGIQIEGTGEKVTDPATIEKATVVYGDKIFTPDIVKKYLADPEHSNNFYKLSPNKIVLFDTEHYPDKLHRELTF